MRVKAKAPTAAQGAPELVAARLTGVVIVLNKSAALAYRRATGLSDFDWRVLSVVGWNAPLTFTQLTERLSHDKGQISRAIKRLAARKLLSRSQARAPIDLTARGRTLCERINALFAERNAVMVRDIPQDALARLLDLLGRISDNAAAILAEEQALHASGGELHDGHDADLTAIMLQDTPPWRSRNSDRFGHFVTAGLAALLGLMRKSAALTYRRELGLSDFDWRVMSQIGGQAPIELARLVSQMSRDKSQVGRSVTRLESSGLVLRRRPTGARAVVLVTTEAGQAVYARLEEIAFRRDRVLRRRLDADEQAFLFQALRTLRANADDLLLRERMLLDGPPAGRAEPARFAGSG
jgi:DNA-binding MarR family transcriptional regulator